jgi:hypothetical protein
MHAPDPLAPPADFEPEDPDNFRNPLWTVVIGMGCLFAAMAALLTLS